MSDQGRAEIGDDTERTAALEKKINTFLDVYPKTQPMDKRKDAPVTELSIREIYRRCLNVMIDIVNDISRILSERDTLSSADFRRQLFYAATTPERRLYVGMWLVFISFVLYFIDAST